ncbi:cytidine deaminase-like protein [Immersiella caudata]|uniref:Cytidine deaminase-like protein n=1 Tax=Immersiella caudata TaxID=314043 RepID=A0AA39WS03_9PEZI|nr:cytidine deaminase-like protein [Immersiella caudata]
MAKLTSVLLFLSSVAGLSNAHPHGHEARATHQAPIGDPKLSINGIPFSTRAHWMRQANLALNAPCPFAAFGSVIVNHTAPGLGALVCTGANSNSATGNPTLHGEMAAINNCSSILTDPTGPYKFTSSQALAAFSQLTLYTNAESCPMCASAIRWAGFKEYVYGTSIDTLIKKGWGQIRISSLDIVAQSFDLGKPTRLIGEVLTEETDGFFNWQFDPEQGCPEGCGRVNGTCRAT